MNVIYPGPHPLVRFRVGDADVTAEAGVPVEVPAEVGKQLVAQGWQQPAPKKGDA